MRITKKKEGVLVAQRSRFPSKELKLGPRMFLVIFLVMLVVVTPLVAALFLVIPAPHPQLSGLKFTVTTDKVEYRYGEVVHMVIVLKNEGKSTLTIRQSMADPKQAFELSGYSPEGESPKEYYSPYSWGDPRPPLKQ